MVDASDAYSRQDTTAQHCKVTVLVLLFFFKNMDIVCFGFQHILPSMFLLHLCFSSFLRVFLLFLFQAFTFANGHNVFLFQS